MLKYIVILLASFTAGQAIAKIEKTDTRIDHRPKTHRVSYSKTHYRSKLDRARFSVKYWKEVVSALERCGVKNEDYIKRAQTSLKRSETHLKRLGGLGRLSSFRDINPTTTKSTLEKIKEALGNVL